MPDADPAAVPGAQQSPPPADPPPAPAATDDAPLGEAGEKALQAWKDRAKKAEADAKRAESLQTELDALKAEKMTDHEKAIKEAADQAAAAARTEVLGSVNSRLFASELKAATAGKLTDPDLLADPTVALKLLGLDEIPVTATGDIDTEAISGAVAELIAAKPYLASATQTPGSADLGARTTPPAKTLDTQIAEAEQAGNWKLSGQLKTQKMLAR